jgi:gliding motility-associated-like protein
VKGNTTMLRAEIIPSDAQDTTVSWSAGAAKIVAVANTGFPTTTLTAKEAGEAMIKVTTTDGAHTATAQVEVYEAEHAPEGFSPNGDGINDYFVCSLDSRDTYALSIFDRSGQVHYRSSDYQNNWDGTANTGPHKGNKMPANIYFYTLSAKKSGQTTTGFVVVKY